MFMTFEFGGARQALHEDEARELARRLRDEFHDEGPALVVATKIELVIHDAEENPSDLRLLDSETNALSWTIARWLEEVGADQLPDRVMDLRYAIDREGRVQIEYPPTGIYLLPRPQATLLAEDLRLTASGQRGEYGIEGARKVADAIEDVLAGRVEGPVRLDDEGAESVFYVLNVSLGDPRSALVAEGYSLYTAIRDHRDAAGHSDSP